METLAQRADDVRMARCVCGRVEIAAFGDPIASTICYCDTCQEGARQLEALPGAASIADSDGGTAYVLYRKDRIKYSMGADLLKGFMLDDKSSTRRVLATCCNSAMVMQLGDAMHWAPVYRARFVADAPPSQWRICTKFKPKQAELPADIPSFAMYPPQLMWRLLAAKLAMQFGR